MSKTPRTDEHLKTQVGGLAWAHPSRTFTKQLEIELNEALDLLHAMATQHWCGCGHPFCNRCADDQANAEVLRRHGMKGPWDAQTPA